MCLGMHLARMETRIVLERLMDRLPGLRLDPDEPRAVHHRDDVPEPRPSARRLGLSLARPAGAGYRNMTPSTPSTTASPPVISPTCAIRVAFPLTRAIARPAG